jgi:hypothetical protein
LLLVLVFLAIPTPVYSQGTRGDANSGLVGEIKGLVDVISQAIENNAPNREIKHLNRALRELLQALEGLGSKGHGKKHHHHGQGLGLIGAKGVSPDFGNGSRFGNWSHHFGKQGAFPAFSSLLNQGGIFLSPGSRLISVQNTGTPGANPIQAGAFTKGLKQTAMACCQCQQNTSGAVSGKKATAFNQSTVVPASNQIGGSAFRTGMRQTGQVCSGKATNNLTGGTSALGRGAGILGGSLVNIKGNNNTVNITVNSGVGQSPNAKTSIAKQPTRTALATAATMKQTGKANSTANRPIAMTKTGKNSNQKAKVEPKSYLAGKAKTQVGNGQKTTSKGPAGIAGKAKSGSPANQNKKLTSKAPAAHPIGKAKTGFSPGMNLASGKKAIGKSSSSRNQGAAKGRTSSGPGNSGAAGRRGGDHGSVAVAHAKTSGGSHKNGR